ncbi:uncharacterized protein LDX57_002490 [Aspergillus melleus]|uniref:uncharacterized protein n=1 Tax=Aspergillus melleus TaxID=138277 RepID=UPI001E8DBE29|nr:uncharacterized protein LDX57_002490 [Aspergillus melleus]KAH8424747.1 hypothetical protein LDX57_002490 [Aspergillus melleus]
MPPSCPWASPPPHQAFSRTGSCTSNSPPSRARRRPARPCWYGVEPAVWAATLSSWAWPWVYEAITTASPKNFEYVRKLGASQVVDYNSATVVEEVVNALDGKTLAGAMDCIGFSTTPLTVEVVTKSRGSKFVSTVEGGFQAPEGVTVKSVFGTTVMDNQVGKAIYENSLPKALKARTFIPAPAPLIVGKGLENVQAAVDRLAEGISAQKVVISL